MPRWANTKGIIDKGRVDTAWYPRGEKKAVVGAETPGLV
jgi:hypothetical protein